MRLCIGTYLKVLSICSHRGNNKNIVKGLTATVDPKGVYDIDDQTVNKLLRCDYDLNPNEGRSNDNKRFSDVCAVARDSKTKTDNCVKRFKDNIFRLLNVNMHTALVLSLRDIIEKDKYPEAETAVSFERYMGVTKADFLTYSLQFTLDEMPKILTGLFLYCAALGENKIGRACNKKNSECPVLIAIKDAEQHSTARERAWKPEWKDKVDNAIIQCGGGCVVCLTMEWVNEVVYDYNLNKNADINSLSELIQSSSQSISDDIESANAKYIKYLANECVFQTEGLPVPQEVLLKTIALEETFVPLRFAIIPEKWDEVKADFDEAYINAHREWFGLSCPISDEGDNDNHPFRSVIFSGPGGGKTTFMKRLVSAYGLGKIKDIDDGLPKRELFPVWIKCRDYRNIGEMSIIDIIKEIPKKAEFAHEQKLVDAFYQLVIKHFNDGDALILFDGLDEIRDVSSRQSFISQIKAFVNNNEKINIIMSSRLVGFKQITNNLFKNFHRWLILPLNEKEVECLCINWHKILFESEPDIINSAKELSNKIISNERIKILAQTPILLTTLLLVNKQSGGRLPFRSTELYYEAIKVLLYTWGIAIRRQIDLRVALPHLSYLSHQMVFANGTRQTIGEADLIEVLRNAQRDLEEYSLHSQFNNIMDFVDAVEERSSLLVQRGSRTKEGTSLFEREYEFLHLTYQEFLTAYAIVNRHYPGATRKSNLCECFENNWENPAYKEVILFTSVLADRWGAEELAQAIIDRIEEVKKSRDNNRTNTITHLKNILLKMVVDDALLTYSFRENIYVTCFASIVHSGIFRSEFVALYESDERKEEMVRVLLSTDNERKIPLFGPFLKLMELRKEESFSAYSHFLKEDERENKDPDALFEALRILELAIWLGWDKSKKTGMVDKILSYCTNDDMRIAATAFLALYDWEATPDTIYNGELVKAIMRFYDYPNVIQRTDKFPVTKDTLIFLQGYFLNETQIKELNNLMEIEMHPGNLLGQFWFGILCGAWDVEVVLQKARDFHNADYMKDSVSSLYKKMEKYLSTLKEEKYLSPKLESLANEYLEEFKDIVVFDW